MEVVLLGTGSPIPDPNRGGSAILVRAAGATLLVDCGRAVVMRLAAAGVLPPMLDRVLLTHLHSDHITDLNDVITTRWVMFDVSTIGDSPVTVSVSSRAPTFKSALIVAVKSDVNSIPSRITVVNPGSSNLTV